MPGDPFTFWTVFFQLAAGLVLLFRRQEPRLPVRLLAIMLLLNAGVTAIWFQVFWPPWDEGRRIAAALDAPTEVLLLAFLAALSPREGIRRAVVPLVVLSVVAGIVAPFMYPHPATSLSRGYEAFRSALFFIGLAAVCFRLAGGAEAWERWAALAFLPRAAYWSAKGGVSLPLLGTLDSAMEISLVLTVPFLVAVTVAAAARLLQQPLPPGRLVAVLVPLTGVAIAIAEFGVRAVQPVDPILIPMLSLLTLGLHRPLFLLMGLAPRMLPPVVARSLVAAGAGSVALVGLDTFYPGAEGAAVLTGFVAGAMTLGFLEVVAPRFETWDTGRGRDVDNHDGDTWAGRPWAGGITLALTRPGHAAPQATPAPTAAADGPSAAGASSEPRVRDAGAEAGEGDGRPQ